MWSTVENRASAAGGADQESIIDYMRRVRGYFLNQAKGTLAAIEFGAESVNMIAEATAKEYEFQAGLLGTAMPPGLLADDVWPIYRASVAVLAGTNANGTRFHFFVAKNKHIRHFVELCLADLVADFLVAVIKLYAVAVCT